MSNATSKNALSTNVAFSYKVFKCFFIICPSTMNPHKDDILSLSFSN